MKSQRVKGLLAVGALALLPLAGLAQEAEGGPPAALKVNNGNTYHYGGCDIIMRAPEYNPNDGTNGSYTGKQEVLFCTAAPAGKRYASETAVDVKRDGQPATRQAATLDWHGPSYPSPISFSGKVNCNRNNRYRSAFRLGLVDAPDGTTFTSDYGWAVGEWKDAKC